MVPLREGQPSPVLLVEVRAEGPGRAAGDVHLCEEGGSVPDEVHVPLELPTFTAAAEHPLDDPSREGVMHELDPDVLGSLHPGEQPERAPPISPDPLGAVHRRPALDDAAESIVDELVVPVALEAVAWPVGARRRVGARLVVVFGDVDLPLFGDAVLVLGLQVPARVVLVLRRPAEIRAAYELVDVAVLEELLDGDITAPPDPVRLRRGRGAPDGDDRAPTQATPGVVVLVDAPTPGELHRARVRRGA